MGGPLKAFTLILLAAVEINASDCKALFVNVSHHDEFEKLLGDIDPRLRGEPEQYAPYADRLGDLKSPLGELFQIAHLLKAGGHREGLSKRRDELLKNYIFRIRDSGDENRNLRLLRNVLSVVPEIQRVEVLREPFHPGREVPQWSEVLGDAAPRFLVDVRLNQQNAHSLSLPVGSEMWDGHLRASYIPKNGETTLQVELEMVPPRNIWHHDHFFIERPWPSHGVEQAIVGLYKDGKLVEVGSTNTLGRVSFDVPALKNDEKYSVRFLGR